MLRNRFIRKAPRHELMNIISDAVRRDGGCFCLSRPIVVFVDDLDVEVPVTVRCLLPDANDDIDEYRIGDSYTTGNLNTSELRKLASACC